MVENVFQLLAPTCRPALGVSWRIDFLSSGMVLQQIRSVASHFSFGSMHQLFPFFFFFLKRKNMYVQVVQFCSCLGDLCSECQCWLSPGTMKNVCENSFKIHWNKCHKGIGADK